MSSRFTPPNDGCSHLTAFLMSSGFDVPRQIGNASTPPRYLKSRLFPSITGSPASGPMSQSENSCAVGHYGNVIPLVGEVEDLLGILLNLFAWIRDSRCVPNGEVVVGVNRNLRSNFDFSMVEGMILHG